MAQYTRKAIIKMFEDMLVEMPFGKITVSALVARCEVSPNTFYYHFHDINHLLSVWAAEKQEEVLARYGSAISWEETLRNVLSDMRGNPDIVYHLFSSLPCEALERFLFGSFEESFYRHFKQAVDASSASEDKLRIVSNSCCYTLSAFILKFIWSNMEMDIDEAVAQFGLIFNDDTVRLVLDSDVPRIG